MRIQHNIMAMSAYRNYTNNVSAMKKNLEKLSSGYKINRAGDDAAGLAISEKMRAQITGLETAQKNAKDGISLVQTAEGALTEVHDMLNRMVELASMSANGTYDDTTDRAQLQKEMDQLKTEIDRIADSANFNGIKLLDGSLDSGVSKLAMNGGTDIANKLSNVKDGMMVNKEPAAGKYTIDFNQSKLTATTTGADQTVTFTLGGGVAAVSITITKGESITGKSIAKAIATALASTGNSAYDAASDTIAIGGVSFNVSTDGSKLVLEMTAPPKQEFKPAALDATLAVTGSSISNQGEQFKVTPEREAVADTGRVYAQATLDLSSMGQSIKDGTALQIGDTTYVFAVGQDSEYKDYGGTVIDLTDMKETDTDLAKKAAQRLAEVGASNKNFYIGSDLNSSTISLTEKEGGVDYKVNNLAGEDGKAQANGTSTGNDSSANSNKVWQGLFKVGKASLANAAGGKSLTLQIGDTADSFNQLRVSIGDTHSAALGLTKISIADQDSAAAAVDVIKKAINTVSDIRGTLGATQNRLDHTINNLSVMTENIQDAESTIRDVDVAEEMMAYTKNNILIQSAQAMLAQANQVPQGVLQLLQ